MRLFLAVELSSEVRERLGRLQDQLRVTGQRIKWVAPRNLHLTVKFLGEVPSDRLPAISAALNTCASQANPFELEVEGLGAFPNLRSPRVVWAGLSGAVAAMSQLAQGIDGALERLGFAAETRPFRAHVTLGRARQPSPDPILQKALEGLKTAQLGRLSVREVVLFRSTLGGSEPVYTTVSQHPLGPGNANAATT